MNKNLLKAKNAILIIGTTTLLSGCISLPESFSLPESLSFSENTPLPEINVRSKPSPAPASNITPASNIKSTEYWSVLAAKISGEIADAVSSKAIYVEPIAPNTMTPFNTAFRNLLITNLHKNRVKIYNSKDAKSQKPINLSVRKMLSAKLNPEEFKMLSEPEKPAVLSINTQIVESKSSTLMEILVTITVYKNDRLMHITSNSYNTPMSNIDYYKNYGKILNVVSK
ncbi:hypothetical protein [Candidatus Thioglobus sp.]|jgi:hypothetical protein|uniref:hypothetical protein n=1 Tax=Candidatus Thioglobus sp. TaxID=2026721 RepID=UPI001771C289|nr:hypothetical protein [Candidatus Thioglobus sp.]HIF48075.1 hypothetical protein [Candidatus Thioglobus sp.]